MRNGAVSSFERKIRFSGCDSLGRLKISSLMEICSDAAEDDFDDRGYTKSFLEENNMAFLLSCISFRISDIPRAGEHITVFTWKHSLERAMFERGFLIKDESGDVRVTALSGWMLVDPQSRKIRRPSDFTFPLEGDPSFVTDVPSLGKIHCGGAEVLEKCGEYTARREHIDGNGHINNAVYGDMISDFMTDEEFARNIGSLRIRFASEITCGGTADICRRVGDGKLFVCGRTENKNNFDSEIVFVQNE